ncbi:hypothetical protein ASPWEDRAFT_168350 [Aspergillus wentii DTO 134E9]|uniref:Camp independent regulatory protein n=1 Tax=Aspergillus wentii DTO 134E9 TaxID=1073089 RepID=A0A1L9RU43_ASPWE|nr:uncharacterized protein ASPWEDRAFT_168350 [Aspergillus wentii DTO 134E9]KAI9934074.1 hypothetical protein MW887_005147 [Aspergillus wentii]OJJ38445.1 hypothetical protein ASPWEDRAFT_168350 [Aspergillus wentii DTO 134E9]
MVNGAAAVLEPTFTGYVATTQDALILFEACLTGVLHHVPRRPHDRERSHLVRSGSVFIYEENSSGIKRWTDGVTWSPSRILGNFLVYRELEKPFPPGEKKRAMKKANRRPVPSTRPGEPYPRQEATPSAYSPSSTASGPYGDRSHQSEVERALVGSLVDSYGFKDSGLVKKTMSVTVSGVTHHLVSYYSVEDVMRGALNPPSMVESLRYIRPRAELTQKQSFRAPIDDLETAGMENPNDPAHAIYGYRPQLVAPPGYAMPNPHPEFYLHASPYAATHPPQSAAIPGYSMAASIPGQQAPNPYLPAPAAPTQIPQKPDEPPHFRAPYGSFDSLSHHSLSSSIPPAINTAIPSSLSDRNRSHSDHSPSAYRNSSISSRSVATDATSPMDPSTPATFSRGSFSLATPLDGTPHPPLEQRGVPAAFDPSISRRESNPIPASYYTGNDRHPYYMGATAPGAHVTYPGAQPLSTWTTAAPAQPQI